MKIVLTAPPTTIGYWLSAIGYRLSTINYQLSTPMSAILPSLKIDSDAMLMKCFTPYQVHWIQSEDIIHAQGKQAFALAEKSVRVGWTYADAFKNVRKRLRFKSAITSSPPKTIPAHSNTSACATSSPSFTISPVPSCPIVKTS